MHSYSKTVLIGVLLSFYALLMGCATPTQPTGGQPDQTPPVIIRTVPTQGTTSFDGDEIRFYFDKYVNRESFATAFRINPDMRLDYRIRWSGRMARVQFEQPLPDSTTIIFSIGTEFSDINRNRIRSPFVLALSTGPTIDEGEIMGRVIDGVSGRSKEGATVLLYRHPFDLTKRADYVAETDSSGKVSFGYLRDGTYKAFWVDDRNRNRTWDRRIEAARPFPVEVVEVEQTKPAQLGVLHVNEPDTIRPELQGIGLFSSTRLRLRFSREMTIKEDASISILDTLGNKVVAAIPLYIAPEDRTLIFAVSEIPLEPSQSYRLTTHNITDIHNNAPLSTSPTFQGSSVADTTRIRLIKHVTEGGVLDDEPHIFSFSTLIDGSVIIDSLQVVQDEIIYTAWEPLEIKNNLLKIIPPVRWQDGSNYTARIYNASSGTRKDVKLTIFQRNRLGGLEINIQESSRKEGVMHHITLKNTQGLTVFSGKTEDKIEISNLAPGNYIVTMFRDDNRDSRWNRGSVYPYEAPEPIVIERGVLIVERMTGELELGYAMFEPSMEASPSNNFEDDKNTSVEMDLFDTEP